MPDTETDTDTDKKWVVKNCVQVFTLHLHNNAIEYFWQFVGLGIGVGQCERTITGLFLLFCFRVGTTL